MSTSTLPDAPVAAVGRAVPAQAPEPGQAAVEVVGSLSPSRAGDFMTCPLLYRFRVVDRLPEPPSPAATRGTLVHAVLERLYDLPAAQRTPQAADGLLRPEWERLLADDPGLADLFAEQVGGREDDSPEQRLAAWLESARDLLAGYFSLEDPRRLEPAERESYVETVLPSGLRLRGYVDRVDVAPSGDVRIVDYKTGRSPGAAFEAKALFQMKFYALVLWRRSGRMPRMLQLMYLGDREVLRWSPDEADLRATERKLGALWAAIERATAMGDFRPRRSRLCDWCGHQALCPEFGGTPPPMPQLPSSAAVPRARRGSAANDGTPTDRVPPPDRVTQSRVRTDLPC